MISRKAFLIAALSFVLMPSLASAGSGGTKKDATIDVVNNTTGPIYAFVDVTPAQVTAAIVANNDTKTLQNFAALGGKQIAAGKNKATFAVKAGAHTVVSVNLTTKAQSPGSPFRVTVAKGQTQVVIVK